MFGYKNTTRKTLILASVLALTGSVAMAQRGERGPRDGDRPAHRQGDRDGKRHHGERGEHGQRGERGEYGPRGDRHGQRGREAMHKRLFADMDLSDEQKDQIHTIMKTQGDVRKAWHEEHKDEFRTLREKMRDAHQADDKEAVQAVREEIKELMKSVPKHGDVHDEIRAVLNDEQQATFDKRIAKMRERMEQWKERRGEGPPRGRRGFAPDDDGAPPHGQRFEGRRRHGARVFGNLDLTDDQKTQLRETMQSDMTREEKMAAVREMLTDEQKTRLDENLKKMREYREKHKGERGERRGRRGDRDGERDGDRPKRDRQEEDGGGQLDL